MRNGRIRKRRRLSGGRTVDAFFKRRCDKLTGALVPVIDRLKAYRDRLVAVNRAQHEAARRAARAEHVRALADAAARRAAAERLARGGQGAENRQRAAEHLRLAEEAEARAREVERCLAPAP